jgi:hypothetical protein
LRDFSSVAGPLFIFPGLKPDFLFLTSHDFLCPLLPTVSLCQVLRVLRYLLTSVTCSKSYDLTYLLIRGACRKRCCFAHCKEV